MTFLRTADPGVQYVMPQQRGIEPRDLTRYPLPPNAQLARVSVVIDELRQQGHTASYRWDREKLVDWDKTRRMDQRSEALYGSGETLLHFVSGGIDCVCTCDGRTVRLYPEHLRMPREGLKWVILGRP